MILCKTDKKKLERAQRRVTNMVWGQEHAVNEERWREQGLPSWAERRQRGSACGLPQRDG